MGTEMGDLKDVKKQLLSKAKELLAAEQKRIADESAAAIADRIKPLPSTDGLDDEQLKQLARELHAAIDKADEQRYDSIYKVEKSKKETEELANKHKELKKSNIEAIEDDTRRDVLNSTLSQVNNI